MSRLPKPGKWFATRLIEWERADLRVAYLQGMLPPQGAREARAAIREWLAELYDRLCEHSKVTEEDTAAWDALAGLFESGRTLKIGRVKDTSARHHDIACHMQGYQNAHGSGCYESMIADAVVELGITKATAVRVWANYMRDLRSSPLLHKPKK